MLIFLNKAKANSTHVHNIFYLVLKYYHHHSLKAKKTCKFLNRETPYLDSYNQQTVKNKKNLIMCGDLIKTR